MNCPNCQATVAESWNRCGVCSHKREREIIVPPPAPLTGSRPLGGDDSPTLKCGTCGDEWKARARRCVKCDGVMREVQHTKRQTGRTTRMLEEALRLAAEGKTVYVMFMTPLECEEIKRRKLREMAGCERLLGIRIETPDTVPNFNWQTFRPYDAHPDCVVLVDHHVIERRFAKLLAMLTRFDAPRALPVIPQPKPFTRQ